ncbi:MAG: nucleotidyl transferase AbiEii/AbiGii toxin family protein [Bacteroidales bacterium]|nr:nucleotidyl transferase AbiEii/AbiGii toxin family protein [Bacteroidales bacterium]
MDIDARCRMPDAGCRMPDNDLPAAIDIPYSRNLLRLKARATRNKKQATSNKKYEIRNRQPTTDNLKPGILDLEFGIWNLFCAPHMDTILERKGMFQEVVDKTISMPSLLTLSAMKAFALGRRAKWKDYVDLYFILKDHYNIGEISREGMALFTGQFSEKLFREQLAFHKDIDYSEPIEYLGTPIPENEIREFLVEKAIDLFNENQ